MFQSTLALIFLSEATFAVWPVTALPQSIVRPAAWEIWPRRCRIWDSWLVRKSGSRPALVLSKSS